MMDILDTLLMNWQRLLVVVVATGLVILFLHKNREALGLWWLGFRHRNIFFGKINQLAKNSTTQNGWFHSERQICQDYKPYYSQNHKSGDYYDECKRYLDIVGEDGRKPLTTLMVIGLMIVLFLEAWGFSYTMSGFIDLTASENTRQGMAYILAFGFAVALALVTHSMGAELHRNKLISSIRSLWKADTTPVKELTAQVGDRVGRIDSPSDLNEKAYIQRLNRLQLGASSKKHNWSIATVVVVSIIAITLTYIRGKALESAQTQDAMCTVQGGEGSQGSIDFNNLYSGDGTPQPNFVAEQNQDAVNAGKNEACDATEKGSWATFGVMAILFLLLQAFATWVSMNFGFAGKHSAEAYKYTHKFSTRDEFVAYYERKAESVADYAQKTLTRLQARMAKKLPDITQSTTVNELIESATDRSFYQFLEWERDQGLERARHNLDRLKQSAEIESQTRKASSLSDDEMRDQLLKEHKARVAKQQPVETEEEQRARLMTEMGLNHD
ncbi:hypothetical protein L9W76_00600 [Vibrio aestuarianus]|uniref:hypothetical protein n=1 Tax=Vibrio aestuarianus TaxID=28171 RepID=UPI00237CE2B2|nr:hypothetical protein [Vibrio aestuarianus]MDE1251687.1 hypothetical protein [Vibrio aestuarianus]MDE1316676.1 hypothetical protein [Vibrio aestuarianus]